MITKKEDKKVYKKVEYLPKKLIQKLTVDIFNNNNTYEYRTKNNFLKCVGIIYHKQIYEYNGLYNYVAIGRSYWKKVFGGNYHEKVLKPLLEEYHIIESYDFGYRTIQDKNDQASKGKQKGLVGIRYRINPDLADDPCEIMPYIQKGKVLTAEEYIYNNGLEFIVVGIPDKDFHVGINHEKANMWIENNAERICREYIHTDYPQLLPDNLLIEYREYLDEGSYNLRFSTVKFAKLIAETRGKTLFYFNKTFYIADVEDFLKHRIPALKYHYKREISKVGALSIDDKRSPVTLRLHNYLVNFPSKILQFITINNSTIVQLDLRTSQFLIFANLLNVYVTRGEEELLKLFMHGKTKTYLKRLVKVLKDHQTLLPNIGVDIHDQNSGQYSNSDVIKFIREVFYTDFYTVVQTELGLPERGVAKQLLFKLFFKKTNRPDVLLNKLSHRYPVVISIIAGFKKHSGTNKSNEDLNRDNNFSVFLQCVEAEIFIDNILLPLRKAGIPCFSRHDSIVVACSYEDEVETFAKDVFKRFEFKYNHKVEDKFWEVVDYEELEDSGYLDWLSDENGLQSDISDEDWEETDEVLTNNDYDMDEIYDLEDHHLGTIEKLIKIGLKEDYYESIGTDLLVEISELPFINDEERNILSDDITNLSVGYNFLQNKTNRLIRLLVHRVNSLT
jgi:hypothetical protein